MHVELGFLEWEWRPWREEGPRVQTVLNEKQVETEAERGKVR